MAASYRAKCIVLKKTKLGEADLILTMLAEDGTQVKGVAKGARKPGNKRFGARVEPYSIVDLQLYPGRTLESITEARCIEPNAACREDLDRSAACSLMCELVAKVIADGEAGEKMFPMLQVALATVAEQPPDQSILYALAFQLKASAMLGVRPAIHECALCGSPIEQAACFDLSSGGNLCSECAGGSSGNIDLAIVPWVDFLLRSTFKQLHNTEGAPIYQLLNFTDSWIREHLGLTLKSYTFLRMV